MTYERRGCTKRGVKPHHHGIAFLSGKQPETLRGEPPLGFEPIRLRIDVPGQSLAKESRVNYSKLFSIGHNAKVLILGHVVKEDMNIVQHAVDKCWAK
jgi:hypothetical protein